VSVGAKNRHKHPHDDLVKVYREQVDDEDNVLETQHAKTIVYEVDSNGSAQAPYTDDTFESEYGWEDDDSDDDDGDGGSTGGGGGSRGGGGRRVRKSGARLDDQPAA
jgi:hypothetical protein